MMESQPLLFHLMLKQGFNWFTLASKDAQVEKCLKEKSNITEMAQEINPIWNFIFGSIRTSLLMDMVNVDLTIQMVKGTYTYRKDHTAESMIFTPFSKKMLPFSSLRHKIQAFQDDKRHEMALPWNNGSTFQFPAPPKMPRNPRKKNHWQNQNQWLGKNRFNPIKTRRPNTPEAKMTDLNQVDTNNEVPAPVKAY